MPDMTISVMTNVSALPKSDIVSDADLARAAAAGDRAANDALRATGKPELAMVEVASADGRSKNLATSAALA